MTTVLAVILVAGLVLDASVTGLVVACAYLLTAPLGIITAGPRARIFGEQAVAPPRRRMQSVFLPIIDDQSIDDPTTDGTC